MQPGPAATAARLKRDTRELDVSLAAAGLHVVGGTRLFRLTEGPNAAALFETLGAAGILTRRFPAQPHWLRFGIPGRQSRLGPLARGTALNVEADLAGPDVILTKANGYRSVP